jgi:hypothetical protein
MGRWCLMAMCLPVRPMSKADVAVVALAIASFGVGYFVRIMSEPSPGLLADAAEAIERCTAVLTSGRQAMTDGFVAMEPPLATAGAAFAGAAPGAAAWSPPSCEPVLPDGYQELCRNSSGVYWLTPTNLPASASGHVGYTN